MKKRTILIIGIIAGSIILVGPLGLSPAILFIGLVLSIVVGNKGDRVAAQIIERGRVTITEIREKNRKAEQVPPLSVPVRPDAPTVPFTEDIVTGHLVEEETLAPDEEDPAFVLGTTEDGRTVTMDEISSLGVGGVPGSGKTVSMVGLACQAVAKYKGNIRFLVVDPHMHSGSPQALSARMSPLSPFYLNVPGLPNPVSGGDALVKWMEWFTKEAKERLSGKESGKKFVLVVDEFTALMEDEKVAPMLNSLITKINEQARKVGMFALLASPAWKANRVNGTDVRNTIASFLVHNMPPNIARQLIPYAEAEKANLLAKGQAIFSSFGEINKVRVPMMSHSDIVRCVSPYLPANFEEEASMGKGPTVSGRGEESEAESEPSIAEVRSIWETYQILDKELRYDEENIIRALALDVYGPEDPKRIEKVKKALKLGEDHLL